MAEAARCAVRADRDCAAELAPAAPSSAAAPALRAVLSAAAVAEAAFDGGPPFPDPGLLPHSIAQGIRTQLPGLHYDQCTDIRGLTILSRPSLCKGAGGMHTSLRRAVCWPQPLHPSLTLPLWSSTLRPSAAL